MSLDPHVAVYVRHAREIEACLVTFRQDLRQLLYEHGVMSNPGWTETDIVDAFRKLLQKKKEQS
jgi:hypothetical protein